MQRVDIEEFQRIEMVGNSKSSNEKCSFVLCKNRLEKKVCIAADEETND